MPSIPLIKILADGGLHSGQDLARALGVSRTAVWKQLSHLEEQGLEIKRIKGQGYSLAGPLDLLDSDALLGWVPGHARDGIDLHLHQSLASTNDCLSDYPSAKPFTVCLAERQTTGRGRRGRPWHSPFARNLYLSLAYDSARGVSGLDGLSLVIGVAVTRALTTMGAAGLSIKWPNDIWMGGRKLAGILVELSGDLQTRCRVVLGLGLNVYMGAEDAASIDQPWTSLAQEGAVPQGGRNEVAGTILSELVNALGQFEQAGFMAFREQWDRLDALKGRDVCVLGQTTSGVGLGIDERGAYCLETESGKVSLNAGEVSIRVENSAP